MRIKNNEAEIHQKVAKMPVNLGKNEKFGLNWAKIDRLDKINWTLYNLAKVGWNGSQLTNKWPKFDKLEKIVRLWVTFRNVVG